jgi:hypothetical protein
VARTPVISVVPAARDLALYAGDGVTIRLNVSESGQPLPLTGVVTAQVRPSRTSATAVDFGVDMTEAATGIVRLSLTGDQTASLASGGTFKGSWDVQWHAPGAEPRTILQGAVSCVLDVTRP